jgi:TonB family protein
VSLTDFPDTIDLAFDETGLPDDGRHEPLFAAVPRPAAVESAEVAPLDPARVDFGPDPPAPKRSIWRGPLGSLLLHLLPLLILVGWPGTPLEIPPPIPIQLVIQQPPPPAPQPSPPAPSAKPPLGPRASDDFGQPKIEKGSGTAPPAAGEPQPPLPARQPAAAAPKPPSDPIPPTETLETALQPPVPVEPDLTPEAPPPKPAPPKQQAAVRMPKPEGLALPLPLSPDQPRQASHSARLPGPDATRDEYCAYALSLTMRHIDLLPLSLLGARHGDTDVAIQVLADGTISSVRVARGSGYSDIDERIAQMVIAVGRFPPLPQWIIGRSMDFTFHMHFPHPAER